MEIMKADMTSYSGGCSEADAGSMQINHSPESSNAGNLSPQSSSTCNFFCSESHNHSGTCMDDSTCSSPPIKAPEKKSVSVRPSPMKKTGVAGPSAVSPCAKKCNKVGSAGGPVLVSRVEREMIVHTSSSNFREVVHQLTGASGSGGDLLPVTLSSRAPANRGNADDANKGLRKEDPYATCDFTGKSSIFRVSKPLPTKLFERRRSTKTLERISTSCRDLPPLVPSPVTPLSSDFERICLPVTPLASPTVVPAQNHTNIMQMHSTSGFQQNGNMQMGSSYNEPSTYMLSNPHQTPSSTENFCRLPSERHNVACLDGYNNKPEASFEDFVIAEKGFFLHPQLPRNKEPSLLPLFPESPRDQ